MTPLCRLGFLALLSCFVLEAYSRPTNNESTTSLIEEPTEKFTDEAENIDKRNERTLEDQIKTTYTQPEGGITREILEKIKEINQGLQKPKRHQINYNTQPYGGGYILDKAILEKIQQIIAAGKLNGLSGQQKVSINDENNSLNGEDIARYENARALPIVQPDLTNNALGYQGLGYMPVPYVTSLPVVVLPSVNGVYGASATNSLNSLNANYLRQGPSLPFQIPWPLAPLFPILLKDPLLHYLQGGRWENLLEYGQSADVCNRKQKSTEADNVKPEISIDEVDNSDNFISLDPINFVSSRQGRKIKKRTIGKSSPIQKLDADRDVTKLFNQKPLGVKKPVKKEDPPIQDTKTTSDNEGDLRFPFGGDFNWFGNRKPVAPSPGFFINRLKVRRGGVAIAGPGGVATAGRGGTAIVGPGGLAYTQPGGLAVAGPAARIVALAPDADLSSVVSRLQQQAAIDGSIPRLLQAIPEGKVVATGPIIYYHPYGAQGTLQYLPFYGGAKGQYLEIKTNNRGNIIGEKIVSEENISSENVVNNTDENLLSKVLAANLQSLKTLSSSVLNLHNLGRKTGSLSTNDKARFKSELASLGETASNAIKLIEEVGDNVDTLFDNSETKRQYENYEENVGEEGVGIDAPEAGDPGIPLEILESGTIADARPVGLAVIGDHGLAASRPIGTAVAVSGIAVARPVGTAIAGLDPTLLGINFQVNNVKS